MSREPFDIDALLSDILDDSKPLPVLVPDTGEEPADEQVDEAAAITELEAEVAAQDSSNLNSPIKAFADSADRTEDDYAISPSTMPSFSADEIAKTLDIRNFATMVTLNTARWHAKVKDRQASKDAAFASDASEDAFETRKRLLTGADSSLKAIHKAIDSARAKYYDMTLPWTTTGMDDIGRRSGGRLLPNTLFFEFTAAMAACKAEMQQALDKFVPEYPNLIETARSKLGKRFDIREYPNAESIRSHFDLSFDFQPIPVGTDFKGLPQQQCNALANAIQNKTAQQMENAMQDLWVRAYKAVGRMAERLNDPNKKFHYTLVDNVRSVNHQLKHLNVTGDQRVEDLRQYIDKHLCQHDIEALRDSPTVRATVAASAIQVLSTMHRIAGEKS